MSAARMTAFTGTWQLVRLILRRDRIRLPIWIVALTAVTGLSASAVISVYGTPAADRGVRRHGGRLGRPAG